MRSNAGVLDRPTLGGVGQQDDDVAACVFWKHGRAWARCAPAHVGDSRITHWSDRMALHVCALDPLAVLTVRELAFVV